tara:strand:+ start:2445 stop:3578 length:1134 start_codon:yes stop_codon:yes gene_type:complete
MCSGALVIFGACEICSAWRYAALALLASAALSLVVVTPASAAPFQLLPPTVAKAQSDAQAKAQTEAEARAKAQAETDAMIPPAPADVAPVNATASGMPASVAPVLKKPVAEKTRYNVVVFGDSLGDGVWAGIYHALRNDKRFNVIRKSKVATGFVRRDYYDWNEAVRKTADDTTIDIAVVIMGTNDRQTIVEDGARYALFTDKWREIYGARVDDFTATLKSTGAKIYWVGLPVMRSATFEGDMKTFTKIFKAHAAENEVTFLPTHDLLADAEGKYAAYGTDAAGRKKLLRAEDGIHFTMQGYEKLVSTVTRAIKQDVDGGVITANASAIAVSGAAAEANPEAGTGAAETIGLKAQIYDVAESRPGRSDDWRWNGAAH